MHHFILRLGRIYDACLPSEWQFHFVDLTNGHMLERRARGECVQKPVNRKSERPSGRYTLLRRLRTSRKACLFVNGQIIKLTVVNFCRVQRCVKRSHVSITAYRKWMCLFACKLSTHWAIIEVLWTYQSKNRMNRRPKRYFYILQIHLMFLFTLCLDAWLQCASSSLENCRGKNQFWLYRGLGTNTQQQQRQQAQSEQRVKIRTRRKIH